MNKQINMNSWRLGDGSHDEEVKAVLAAQVKRQEITHSEHGDVEVYFDNIETHLTEHIRRADAVLGCVAWLTSDTILDALAQLKHVTIVVQKEDFLRPDIGVRKSWSKHLRRKYDALPDTCERHWMLGLVGELSVCSSPEMGSVRCVGNVNTEKSPAFPRSHHKFIVFCKFETRAEVWGNEKYGYHTEMNERAYPYAVWTGSFNFTKNAGASLENALYITDPAVVSAYYHEFGYVYGLSEPLDWETTWSAPEFRIGT